jgi:hypothetical protein
MRIVFTEKAVMNILKQKYGWMLPSNIVLWMRSLLIVSAVLLTSSYSSSLWAAESRLSITQQRDFEQLQYNLQALVKDEGKKCVPHHFFVAKYPPGRNLTYMFWREGRALWILELGDGSPHHWESIIANPRSGTRIDLDKDVVDDPGTSTYLVGSAWVNNIIFDTVLNGDLVVIKGNPDCAGD